ncbi:protein bunched, class 1/class 3/D/E isoforms [Agrilus planipennis]|uniref:Protein bunched, class 1/class 3/D/E isoforms n=1 Tax=Agrilus planipennis TaxID=224129 RepID=A0A1W4WRB4_AGRPL|nr:protein bunched, class 1/class 3/D/E isoforms [Agrilus planipennis]
MKADCIDASRWNFNSVFSMKTENVLKDIVIQYLDYFYPNCANNANAAIDNKIEKAMDLVKSHLMYTVREEVDVLKEKIVELMDRINQLEIENNYLKANVSPEVLTALNNGAARVLAEKEADKSKEEENDGQTREQ